MLPITRITGMINKGNQNQTGQTGGEKLKKAKILVKIKWKFKTIIETTAGIVSEATLFHRARSFLRHLTYFFRRCFRTYLLH